MKIEYAPIDYSNWDFSGKGKNIMPFLDETQLKIWELSLPFQDSRKGETGHGEVVTYFALVLSRELGLDRSIVIPAAILHDVGWSKMPQSVKDDFFLPGFERSNQQMRKEHEQYGVKIARDILKRFSYPIKETNHILEIISQHDTRKGWYSHEDGAVRDADKLYRYTLIALMIDVDVQKSNIVTFEENATKKITVDSFFYHTRSRDIARLELKNTLEYYKNHFKALQT